MLYYKLNDIFETITCFSTTREGGASKGSYKSFNISPYSGDDSSNWLINKHHLCQQLNIDEPKLIISHQTHGTEIQLIDESFFCLSDDEKANRLNGIDGLITSLKGVCIGITTADCVPLIFFDHQKQVTAVAHAGWRGTCARIAEKILANMQLYFNSHLQNIYVIIGPSISVSAYKVGKEVIDTFDKENFDIERICIKSDHSYFLNLWEANRITLERAGILTENIEISGICTFTEHERFFSARHLGIKSGRIYSGIIMR